MKEPDYNIVNGELVKFNYTVIVADKYRYRHTVDNHNELRHYGGTNYQIFLESLRG